MFGAGVAAYRIFDFLTFEMHWLFVAESDLHSHRRSLITFLMNIVEMAFYFAILLELTGCVSPDRSLWGVVGENISKTFSFGVLDVNDEVGCGLIPVAHLLVMKLLVGLIIVSLTQEIRRKQADRGNNRGDE